MFESDDLFQLIMGFLIGIFICCLLKKRNSYEGFFGYQQYNYNNNMFENNKNLSGNSNTPSCNFSSKEGTRNNNIQWGTNRGWWATILNNTLAYDEITTDFEYTITDPNFVNQFRGSKNDKEFKKDISKIEQINKKYVEKITELFNGSNLDFEYINKMNPLFAFPLNENSTADDYIKNFDSMYKRTFEVSKQDKKSLWNLYKDQLDYIKNIYVLLSDDDQEIMAEKIPDFHVDTGKWQKLSDWISLGLPGDPAERLFVRYYDEYEPEEINSLISQMFPPVASLSRTTNANGDTCPPGATKTETATNCTLWIICDYITKCTTTTDAITTEKAMINKININIGIIEKYNKYNIQDYGYINAYKKLIEYTGDPLPNEDEEYYKYYNLFDTILEVDTPNDDEFPFNGIISDWVSYVNVYGTINGRSILKLYNIGQDNKNTGCSNNKGRCYFNDTGEVGKDAIKNAWGSFYKDSPGNRSNKSYLSPYMMKGNKDRGEMYNFEKNSDKDAKEKCESIVPGIIVDSSPVSPWRKSPNGLGESGKSPNYCYLSSISDSVISNIPDYSKCAEFPWPEPLQTDSPP